MRTDVINIAIIGAGPRAQEYMAAVTKLSDLYRLSAICDLHPQRGQWAAKKYGADALFPHIRNLMAEAKPDVVFALTPTLGRSNTLELPST